MIDGYKIKDGKVLVFDYDEADNVVEEERKYQDNIEELLMEENIRDYLNNLKNVFKNSIKEKENDIKKWQDERFARVTIMFVVMLIVGLPTCIVLENLIFGLDVLLFGSFIASILAISCNKKIKKLQKEKEGYELGLVGVNEEIEKNKIKLRRLKNDDSVEQDNIRSRNYVQLNNVDELKRLSDYLKLWCIVGSNEMQLMKYYEKGKMFSKLGNDFSNEEIKTLRRILVNNNEKKY